MFNKSTSNPQPQPAARPETPDSGLDMPSSSSSSSSPTSAGPRRAAKAASLISGDMRIEGSVMCEGELQVDGEVKGDVKVQRLTIGENGAVEGSVVAENVECRGRVVGSISAKQVRLYAQAHIDGDISHEQLAMEAGAFFQGRSLRLQRPAAAAPKPVAAVQPQASSGLSVPPPPAGSSSSSSNSANSAQPAKASA